LPTTNTLAYVNNTSIMTR